jgi:enoyl-CoA hydratase/carnithine racemase
MASPSLQSSRETPQRFTKEQGKQLMSDIVTERSGSILRVELNRPAKKNAMTSSMYATLADLDAAKDEGIRVVLWYGAGESFCAGNDVGEAAMVA